LQVRAALVVAAKPLDELDILLGLGRMLLNALLSNCSHMRVLISKLRKLDTELTTDEVMKRLFPKKVRERMKEIAHEKNNKQLPKPCNSAS
jgi:hypothetical protein